MENSFAVVKNELAKQFGKDGFEVHVVSNSDETFSLLVRRAPVNETKDRAEMKHCNDPAEVTKGFESFGGW